MFIKRKGQSTLEYAILIFAVVAGILATQIVLKRGFQGKVRESAEEIGEAYSAYYSNSSITTTTHYEGTEDLAGGATKNTITAQTQAKTGSEYVGPISNDHEIP